MMGKIEFAPTFAEQSRQSFVASFKGYVNSVVETGLSETYHSSLVPLFEDKNGRPPENRSEAAGMIEPHPLFKLWASLTYHSQNLMWQSVNDTTQRTINDQVAAFTALESNPGKQGSLDLADNLEIPAPVRTTEIHRQPGGYWRESRPNDIETALSYTGTVDLYRNAKGMGVGGKIGSDSMGRMLAAIAQKRAPDLTPSTILDMGCGTGEQTLAYKRIFPEAEVHGLDVARPFVRYAHGLAESEGLALHFKEADAASTGYGDESFDLIVSIIMFHETSNRQIKNIFGECWRLLKPGGMVLHLDVPYQPDRMPLDKQVTNHWQVKYNGEPFWTGFVETDIRRELLAAGFEDDSAFAEYENYGPVTYFFFGGRKKA